MKKEEGCREEKFEVRGRVERKKILKKKEYFQKRDRFESRELKGYEGLKEMRVG